jgi:hypothetical protein
MDKPIIQSLWIGTRLSVMEQLSIRSYLAQGYSFHLYVYEPLENVPAGVVLRRAAEILGPEEIFCYQTGPGKGSVAAFSNSFRYKLLLERGGWWTDLDSVCLRRLDFAEEHVLGLQRYPDGSQGVNSGLIKAPPAVDERSDPCRGRACTNSRSGRVLSVQLLAGVEIDPARADPPRVLRNSPLACSLAAGTNGLRRRLF